MVVLLGICLIVLISAFMCVIGAYKIKQAIELIDEV